MAPHSTFLLFTILTFSLSFHGIFAAGALKYKYVVINESPNSIGGMRFEKEIGGPAGLKKMLPKITSYILFKILKQMKPADRIPIDTITIKINDCSTCGQAMTLGEVITVSTIYLKDYKGPLTLKQDFNSIIHHEMTHVLQYMGLQKNQMLVEGVADYTCLKAGLFPPQFFAKPGQGKKWDQGYDVTARFLDYCDSLVPNFVPKLNMMLKEPYDISFFKNLTGKPVEQLWTDYKAKYGNIP